MQTLLSLSNAHCRLDSESVKSLSESVESLSFSLCDCVFQASHDFYEGVLRAILMDRDSKPKWKPPTPTEITPDIVEHHFTPCSDVGAIMSIILMPV